MQNTGRHRVGFFRARLAGGLGLCAYAPFTLAGEAPGRPESAPRSARDRAFLQDAGLETWGEIQFGKVALQKAADPEVKAFARQMVQDHSQIREELASLAAQHGVPLPEWLTGEARRDYQRLEAHAPARFDRLYVYMMAKWHAVAVRGYQAAAQSAADPGVRAWAADVLPRLRHHLDWIKRIAQRKGVPINAGNGQQTLPTH